MFVGQEINDFSTACSVCYNTPMSIAVVPNKHETYLGHVRQA